MELYQMVKKVKFDVAVCEDYAPKEFEYNEWKVLVRPCADEHKVKLDFYSNDGAFQCFQDYEINDFLYRINSHDLGEELQSKLIRNMELKGNDEFEGCEDEVYNFIMNNY